MDDVYIVHRFGRVDLQSRMRREGLRFIGEGRALHYDMAGNLLEDTGWRPTGCTMTAPDEETAALAEAVCR